MMAAPSKHAASATPPSPSASFYDLSDVDEDEYSTIMHSSSGKGVKLLFSKSKVYVHPTPSSKENISGYIALIQQKPTREETEERPSTAGSSRSIYAPSYLLAWLPEHSLGDAHDAYVKVEASDGSSPPKRTPLVPAPLTTKQPTNAVGAYAFAIPLSEIYSLLIRPPSIGWWYGSIVINTRSGDGFPALFFHDDECQSTILQKKRIVKDTFDPFGEHGGTFWGGDEVLRWVKRYVPVERSSDPSIYLIDPSPEDKVGFGGKPLRNVSPTSSTLKDHAGTHVKAESQPKPGEAGMDPFVKALKQARWGFLEKMSQVTTFTRKTAQDLILDNPRVHPQLKRLMRNPEVQTIQDDFDSARVYLARWAMGIAEESERERQQRIWTARDVLETESSDVGEFEILEAANISLIDKRKPVELKEWASWFSTETGRLQVTPDEVKERIFHGGLSSSDGVRKEAWLFLLGVYEWDSTAEERRVLMNRKGDEFVRLKGGWWERTVEGHGSPEAVEWWKEQKSRIEKDVHRTDRHIPLFEGEDIPHPDPDSPFAETGTNVHLEQMKDMLLTYNEYNKDLGYVQGMSDLLAPLYAVMQDDAVAFWAFVKFMDRMERNFLRDQSGMRVQLLTLDHLVQLMDPKLYLHLQSADSTNFFFFFRMLLVWYKREFQWSDVLRLWETLWTDYYSSSFHLFIALSILEKHRDVIMEHLKHFDEVLKYINELSNTIELETTLIRAESLFRRFQRTVEAVDRKSNFPAPALRQRKPVEGDRKPTHPMASGSEAAPEEANSTVEEEKTKVISPELRSLLSRKIILPDK